jgi:hypothetical protein
MDRIASRQIKLIEHLLYSPYLATADYFFLPRVKRELAGLTVTDGVEEVCVDHGEMGAILEAGGVGGPGPPGGGRDGQLASNSGEG